MGVCGGCREDQDSQSVQRRSDKNPSTSKPFAGSLINTPERKLTAFLLAWRLLLLLAARLSSLITGKFILLDFHLEQEDVLGNSSDSVAILTNLDNDISSGGQGVLFIASFKNVKINDWLKKSHMCVLLD